MIKTLLACTSEIINAEVAVNEILDQIGIPHNLLTNSVAIISCSPDLAAFGLVEDISKKLPFPSVGCTTFGNAIKDNYGFLTPMLTVTVLTSDDVQFVAMFSNDLVKDTDSLLLNKNELLELGYPDNPALILSFSPQGYNIDSSQLVKRLNQTFDNIPVFGTFASDPEAKLIDCTAFYNGECSLTKASFILVYGEIKPSFFVLSLSENKIRQQKDIITSSENFLLKEINDMPILDYMKTIGITKGHGLEALITIPFIIDFNDGTEPITRTIFSITKEGYALCAGDMPQNQTLSIGTFEPQDILDTAEKLLEKVLKTYKTNGLLLFSCVTRSLILGQDVDAELAKIYEKIGDKIPYHISYAGGEICPSINSQGKFINRLHNCSIIACVF